MTMTELKYMTGFGNTFESEALPNALPRGRNSPQRCNYGLYAEQLSGTAFTMPQATNARSWLYRILPSVKHAREFRRESPGGIRSAPCRESHALPIGAQRWNALPLPSSSQTVNFIEGMTTITTAGDADARSGMAAHVYVFNRGMDDAYLFNADGEYLIVPQQGGLRFDTEFGALEARPGDIVVMPRGVVFRVKLLDADARGFICENYGARFALPERGPIGANALASARDFCYPVAAFEERENPGRLWAKWGGDLYSCHLTRSPLDVVAWHGNYAPCKYDLRAFSPVGALAFDHPDPSIFTVLTAPSSTPGVANVDFVIFPERWQVAEDTFRPPWFHRNTMSEFMGLIYGAYDAKPHGMQPGAFTLHNAMLAHGPDADAFEAASRAELKPVKLENTLAFMFESGLPQRMTKYAATSPQRDAGYADCWRPLKQYFNANDAP